MRDSIKRKIHRLIHAINEALSDSEEITDSVDGVRDEGYDLFLILEATVVLNRQGDIVALDTEDWDEDEFEGLESLDIEGSPALLEAESESGESANLSANITETDQEFLRTLGIRVED